MRSRAKKRFHRGVTCMETAAMEWRSASASTPPSAKGKACIKGTRIPVAAVLDISPPG
jgi:uncharacterized protein (DUF433 family)